MGTGGEGIVASEMFVVDEEGNIEVQCVITVTGTQIIVGPYLNFSFTAVGGDTFTGGAYSDEMIAGPGKSTFYGGAAADRITFNTLLQNAEDTFADFVQEVDIIEFSKSSFTGFSGNATNIASSASQLHVAADVDANYASYKDVGTSTDHRLAYDPDSGNVWYDPPGSADNDDATLVAIFGTAGNHPATVDYWDFHVVA